ncbi:MAG: hypothetical protein HQK75_04770 [Candidatus Magnetomorum sp.]|nr:hypothetical protein [Candidatus Magnetomorum sp.]
MNFIREIDGRPLYAYKCTDTVYQKIKADMLNQLSVQEKHPMFPSIFCLYAAETWRRKHESGPWKWETIFSEISKTTPSYPTIYKWVASGLQYWNRSILTDNGKQLYLVTIACEGGLPLLLLQKENAKLNRFFKNLLEQYHYKRHLPDCDITKIAQTLSFNLLPKSLCNDVVYKLSGNLVSQIVQLQEKVRDADDPIAALDTYNPDWRDTLPLSLENKTISLLLNDLVINAKNLSISTPKQLQWQLFLVQHDHQWRVEKHLNFSTTISGSVLKQWLKKDKLPYRMRLMIESSCGIESLALITYMHLENKDQLFRCELLNRHHKHYQSIILSNQYILENVRLFITDETFETELKVIGPELGDLPWIFKEHNNQLAFLGEGSIHSSSDLLTIAAPQGGKWSGNDNVIDHLGCIDSIQRYIYQILGTCEWHHDALGKCMICSDSSLDSNRYIIQGKKLSGTTDQDPPYQGMPDLHQIDTNSIREKVNTTGLEWSPFGKGNLNWNTDHTNCSGIVWIRYMNADGYQVLLRKIRVVPENMQIEIIQTGQNDRPGILAVKGLASIEICSIDTRCHCYRQSDDTVEIHCMADSSQLKTDFLVRLEWPDLQYMDLSLPFPCAGGAFIDVEKTLKHHDRIALSRLSMIKAIAQASRIHEKFFIRVKIKTRAEKTFYKKMNYRYFHDFEFDAPFCQEAANRHIFYLHRIQEKIKSLISLTGDMDSIAEIFIVQNEQQLASIEVGSFDLWFERVSEKTAISIHKDCMHLLNPEMKQQIVVRMIQLWNPEAPPIELQRLSDNSWEIPEQLMPGPYWVLGELNNLARFRPILVSIPGHIEQCSTQIEQAIRTSYKNERLKYQTQWINDLASDPNHEEWQHIFNFLKLVEPYPASALDVFSCMIQSPEAMVMALLKSSDDEFEAVWSLSYQFPFSWYLVPAIAWFNAFQSHILSIKKSLESIDPDGELLFSCFESFQNRLIIRQPIFRPICDWLGLTVFPDKPLKNSELMIAQHQPDIIENTIHQHELQFQGRYGAHEFYPEGPEVLKWTEHSDFPSQHRYLHMGDQLRPIRCAPFVAAYICLHGKPYEQKLLFEIKKLRHFDKEWFAQAYGGALCLGLSQQLKGGINESFLCINYK